MVGRQSRGCTGAADTHPCLCSLLPCAALPPPPRSQVEFSKQLNESRLKVLQAREEAVQAVLREAYAKLAALSSDKAAYKQLLADLLAQALYKLSEPKALVRVRKVDEPLVKDVLAAAKVGCWGLRKGGSGGVVGVGVTRWTRPWPWPGCGETIWDEPAAAEVGVGEGRPVCVCV